MTESDSNAAHEAADNKPHFVDLTEYPLDQVFRFISHTIENTTQHAGTAQKGFLQQLRKDLLQGNLSQEKIIERVDKLIAVTDHNNRLIGQTRKVLNHPTCVPINRKLRPLCESDPEAIVLHERDIMHLDPGIELPHRNEDAAG